MSRPTSVVIFLAMAAAYTVFMTCSNAISVECLRRYADCSREKFADESRCGRSLSNTSRSITFEMVVRLDIGRQLDIRCLSSPGFLSICHYAFLRCYHFVLQNLNQFAYVHLQQPCFTILE